MEKTRLVQRWSNGNSPAVHRTKRSSGPVAGYSIAIYPCRRTGPALALRSLTGPNWSTCAIGPTKHKGNEQSLLR